MSLYSLSEQEAGRAQRSHEKQILAAHTSLTNLYYFNCINNLNIHQNRNLRKEKSFISTKKKRN